MEGGSKKKGTLRSAWRHRQFRSLLMASAISGVGDHVYTVALAAYVLDQTGSAAWVGAVALVRIVPFALFAPVGGVIAGRYDRRLVMIVFDALRAALMAMLAIAAQADTPAAVVLVFAFCSSAATTVWRPAAVAATPTLVGEDDLAAANAVQATVSQLSMFAGPALGAVLFAVTSAALAFAVNGATFLLSAGLIWTVTDAGRPARATARTSDSPGWRDDLAAGWRVLCGTDGLVLIQGLLFAVLFAYGFEIVLHPLVAARRLDIGPEGAGYLLGAMGIGGLIAAPFSGRIASGTRSGAVLAISIVLLGAPFALLAVVHSPVVACVLLVGEGVGNIVFDVLAITFVQRLVTGDDLARVFGLQVSACAIATVTGAIAAPILVETFGLQTALIAGGAVVLCGLVAVPKFARLGRTLAESADALAPVVDGLGRLGLFEGASRAALERIARATVAEEVPAGTAVLRQGDPSDDLYIVREGTLQVTASAEDGRLQPLPDLVADDWFGEIGLLQGVPRTATVTAATAVSLWRIPGEVFLSALLDLDSRPALLQTRLAVRVARTHPSLASGFPA